jgi:hypothetical protein
LDEAAARDWFLVASMGPGGDVDSKGDGMRLSPAIVGCVEESPDQIVDEAVGPGCYRGRDCDCHGAALGEGLRSWVLFRFWGIGLGQTAEVAGFPIRAQRDFVRQVGHHL